MLELQQAAAAAVKDTWTRFRHICATILFLKFFTQLFMKGLAFSMYEGFGLFNVSMFHGMPVRNPKMDAVR